MKGFFDLSVMTRTYTIENIEELESVTFLNLRTASPNTIVTRDFCVYNLIEWLDMLGVEHTISTQSCCLWKGKTSLWEGYNRPTRPIGKYLFEIIFGIPVPPQITLRHMCPLFTGQHNKGLCCNPLHLRLGTHEENMRDKITHNIISSLLKNHHTSDVCFVHGCRSVDPAHRVISDQDLKRLSLLFDIDVNCKCDCTMNLDISVMTNCNLLSKPFV